MWRPGGLAAPEGRARTVIPAAGRGRSRNGAGPAGRPRGPGAALGALWGTALRAVGHSLAGRGVELCVPSGTGPVLGRVGPVAGRAHRARRRRWQLAARDLPVGGVAAGLVHAEAQRAGRSACPITPAGPFRRYETAGVRGVSEQASLPVPCCGRRHGGPGAGGGSAALVQAAARRLDGPIGGGGETAAADRPSAGRPASAPGGRAGSAPAGQGTRRTPHRRRGPGPRRTPASAC